MTRGFSKTYQTWFFHEEKYGTNVSDESMKNDIDVNNTEVEEDDMIEVLQDIVDPRTMDSNVGNDDETSFISDHRMKDRSHKLDNLFNEMETELYPGCKKFFALTFLVKLMNILICCLNY